jgi:RNA polymerase sigma factor (sigma-70 family)
MIEILAVAQPLTETGAGAVDSDRDARLGRLIRKQFGFVWRLARRIGLTESEVDAAVRDVFAAAAQRIGDIRPANERAFLFSKTLHVAARVRRNRGEPAATTHHAAALGELDEAGQAREILGALLERMPLELRVVFVLHEIEQLSTGEIAEIVGIPLSTVTARLAEAEEQFATHLASENERSLPLIAAARAERAPAAALVRALRAAGLRITGEDSEAADAAEASGGAAADSVRMDAVVPRSSTLFLAATWLLLGWVVGLVVVSAVWALSDAATTTATPASSTR